MAVNSLALRAHGLIAEADIEDHAQGTCATAQLVHAACRTFYLWQDEGQISQATQYRQKVEKYLGYPLPITPGLTRMEWEEQIQSWKNQLQTDAGGHKEVKSELMVLRAVSDEYNAWIRAHASGMEYDEFLKQYLRP